MSCFTIEDLLAAALADDLELYGVTAAYYPQVLTGYTIATQVRNPSETTAVNVTGWFQDEVQVASDGALTATATFIFSYSSSLGFTPHANDRLVITGMSYRVSKYEIERFGGTVVTYTATLESEGVV